MGRISLVYGNLVGGISLYCAARAHRMIPAVHPTLTWLAQVRNARLLDEIPPDAMIDGEPLSHWHRQLADIQRRQRAAAVELDKGMVQMVLCGKCAGLAAKVPGLRWHELFLQGSNWLDRLPQADAGSSAEADDEDDELEDDQGAEDTKAPDEQTEAGRIAGFGGPEPALGNEAWFSAIFACPEAAGTGVKHEASRTSTLNKLGWSDCPCDKCMKQAQGLVKKIFRWSAVRECSDIGNLLKLYDLKLDSPSTWANPAAPVRLYGISGSLFMWKRSLNTVELGRQMARRSLTYSGPLKLDKIAEELAAKEGVTGFAKLCEDWDIVTNGRASSEGADLHAEVFIECS